MSNYSFDQSAFQKIFVPGGSFVNGNIIMVNCADEIFDMVKKSHTNSTTLSCIININKKMEQDLQSACHRLFDGDKMMEKTLSRFLVNGLIAQEMLKKGPAKIADKANINTSIFDVDFCKLFSDGSKEDIQNAHAKQPLAMQIDRFFEEAKIEELAILCPDGIKTPTLQSAINMCIVHHSPFNVKLFTKDSSLSSSHTLSGVLMQSIHDYEHVDSNLFLTNTTTQESTATFQL